MPIYEYECGACGEGHEFIQKFSDGPKRKCPSCGKLRLKKKLSAPAFHLKGTGWYVTDFRESGKGKAADKAASDASTDTSTESGAGDSSSDTKSEPKANNADKKKPKSSSKPDGKSSGASA